MGCGVRDLEASYAHLSSKDMHFTTPPVKQPWGGFMALFTDPDGNVFYLNQLRGE